MAQILQLVEEDSLNLEYQEDKAVFDQLRANG